MNNTYMSNICYNSPKLAVKDSFDDEEISDDVEDEVFIRDGKSGFKLEEEIGVKRPLMASRRKVKYNHLHVENCKRTLYKRFCVPYCCGLSFAALFLGIAVALITLLNVLPFSFDRLKHWTLKKSRIPIVPCTEFLQEEVWHQSFVKFKSEAAITTFDSNQDSIFDIVIGFATDIKENEMPHKCSSDFPDSGTLCGGGVMVLDGRTGSLLWRHWTRSDVLFIDCSANVNAEGTKDCLVSGKGGVLCILDGRTGSLIWELSKGSVTYLLDLYSAQYVPDLNNDGLAEVLISHSSESSGHLIVVNGRDGRTLGQLEAPDKESIFIVPRVVVSSGGSYMVLFATGSFDISGSLYVVPLFSITQSDLSKVSKIWTSTKGISSSIVLADMNGDLMEDIILTLVDRITILSGRDYSVIRNITSIFPNSPSQILTGPTPAYFDDDEFPDLLITQMVGPSFPTYYFSESWVSSGKEGENLLDEPVLGNGDVIAPGIGISFTGTGNDMFLYWKTTCNTYPQSQKQPFSFSQDTSIHEKTHANLCQLRFNTSLETQLYLLNQHIEPPGVQIYSSKEKWSVEHNISENHVAAGNTKSNENANDNYVNQDARPPHSVFRHKSTPLIGGPKNSLNYPRFGEDVEERDQWERPISYSDSLPPILPDINLGALAMDEDQNVYQNPTDIDSLDDDGRDERAEYRNRMKRNGHFQDFIIPRATSSASLVKSLDGSGIDIIFASHWEASSPNIRILLEKDSECVRRKVLSAQNSNNLNALEMEVVEDTAERECLGERPLSRHSEFHQHGLGRLTIYRLTLSCVCSSVVKGIEECSRPLPIEQQSYPMRASDIYFKTRSVYKIHQSAANYA